MVSEAGTSREVVEVKQNTAVQGRVGIFSRIWGNWRWEALEILILEDKSIVFVKYEIGNVKLQT